MIHHTAAVTWMLDGSHGYPYRAVCECGWQSRGYVAAHAAQAMADEHYAARGATITDDDGNDWHVSDTGALWTRKLASGQLAAIWRYSETSGAYYKLLTDRDLGDYLTLDAAMAVAALVETSVSAVS